MDRDATFLLALVMLAVAALVVGATGWVLFARDHRAWKTAHVIPGDEHHPSDEGT